MDDAQIAAERVRAANNASSNSPIPHSPLQPPPPPPFRAAISPPSHTLPARNASSPAANAVKQPVPQKVGRGGSSAIVVNTRQKGNPILSHVKNVPWEYGDIIPDYVLGQTTCALFLSLKYHRLHPEYIYTRIKSLGHRYNLRILLCLVDIENHHDPLRELSKTALVANLTLLLAWTSHEAGRYLETFKAYEHTPPTLIQEKQSTDYTTRLVEVVTQVRSVNKVDAVSLVSNFGSVRAAVNAAPEEILMISGWGQQKVARWEKAVGESFRVSKARKSSALSQNPGTRGKATASASIAAKLGIGPAISTSQSLMFGFAPEVTGETSHTESAKVGGAPASWGIDVEEDEDAIVAAAEAEAEERSRSMARTGAMAPIPAPASPEVSAGITEALAKLRERKES